MAVASNALTTVASLKRYLRTHGVREEVDYFRVYHDGTGGVTSATLEITSTAVVLVDNVVGTTTLTFASNATLSAMVSAIDAVAGYVVVMEGDGSLQSSDLSIVAATNIFGSAQETYFRGIDELLLEDVIDAASDEIERWTGQVFASASYRQAMDGNGTDRMVLPYAPVTAVARVGFDRETGTTAKYTSTTARYANVEVTSSAVKLTVDGTTTTLTFATYATMTALSDAIAAVSGWTSTVPSNAGGWSTGELLATPPVNALNQEVALEVLDDADIQFAIQTDAGVLVRHDVQPIRVSPIGRLNKPFGYHVPVNVWPEGWRNIIVEYTAGFTATPDDVEEVCNELAANMMRAGYRDGALAAESTQGSSYSATGEGVFTDALRRRIAKYRRLHRTTFVDV